MATYLHFVTRGRVKSHGHKLEMGTGEYLIISSEISPIPPRDTERIGILLFRQEGERMKEKETE